MKKGELVKSTIDDKIVGFGEIIDVTENYITILNYIDNKTVFGPTEIFELISDDNDSMLSSYFKDKEHPIIGDIVDYNETTGRVVKYDISDNRIMIINSIGDEVLAPINEIKPATIDSISNFYLNQKTMNKKDLFLRNGDIVVLEEVSTKFILLFNGYQGSTIRICKFYYGIEVTLLGNEIINETDNIELEESTVNSKVRRADEVEEDLFWNAVDRLGIQYRPGEEFSTKNRKYPSEEFANGDILIGVSPEYKGMIIEFKRYDYPIGEKRNTEYFLGDYKNSPQTKLIDQSIKNAKLKSNEFKIASKFDKVISGWGVNPANFYELKKSNGMVILGYKGRFIFEFENKIPWFIKDQDGSTINTICELRKNALSERINRLYGTLFDTYTKRYYDYTTIPLLVPIEKYYPYMEVDKTNINFDKNEYTVDNDSIGNIVWNWAGEERFGYHMLKGRFYESKDKKNLVLVGTWKDKKGTEFNSTIYPIVRNSIDFKKAHEGVFKQKDLILYNNCIIDENFYRVRRLSEIIVEGKNPKWYTRIFNKLLK